MPQITSSLAGFALAISLAAATPVSAETRQFDGTRPEPGIECDGLILPNFGDCKPLNQTSPTREG